MKAVHALLFVASAFAATAVSTAVAQPGWEEIGSREVGAFADHDTIPVRGLERFRQVRFCVVGGPVHIFDAEIKFANGGSQAVEVRSVIRAGTCTRVIDLNGANRNMTEIKFVYERLRPRMRPRLRVEAL